MPELEGTPQSMQPTLLIAQIRNLKPGPRGQGQSQHWQPSGLTWPEPQADLALEGSVNPLDCAVAPATKSLHKSIHRSPACRLSLSHLPLLTGAKHLPALVPEVRSIPAPAPPRAGATPKGGFA